MWTQFIAAALLLVSSYSFAEDQAAEPAENSGSSRQSGEIVLEETDAPKRDSRAVSHEAAKTFVDSVAQSIKDGGQTPVGTPDEGTLLNMAVTYLYCISKAGSCPFFLDTILEADIINGREATNNECPIMSRFWKVWLKNDLEGRQKYLVSIVNVNTLTDFNTKQRPRYLRCKDMVGQAVTALKTGAKRYTPGTPTETAVTRTVRFFQEVHAKNLDVFAATDVKFASKKE